MIKMYSIEDPSGWFKLRDSKKGKEIELRLEIQHKVK